MNTLLTALNLILPHMILADVAAGPMIALVLLPWILLFVLIVCIIAFIIKLKKKK